jgi:hypothetical protein
MIASSDKTAHLFYSGEFGRILETAAHSRPDVRQQYSKLATDHAHSNGLRRVLNLPILPSELAGS